jgi:hypothetical protein
MFEIGKFCEHVKELSAFIEDGEVPFKHLTDIRIPRMKLLP